MAKEMSVEEAVERARRAQDQRVEAVRTLALGRQELADVRTDAARQIAEAERAAAEQIKAAERADVKAFNAALSAGWSVDELKKIGYAEPDKKARARRRQAARTRATDEAPTQPADHGE
ncbi:hypothetical protein GCM10025865_33650 (plasmid) [Paraoerskovia sediminicola]|uniref:Uncharacterized protein n=1 Tax=Paraoerskovia sediminicola TaxID=1138587 RepID=A0ABM8G7E7_9CELL|nr:hypothetical protein [Paraoerskovia sediminicola]BDZ44023.1 hypothetical protein GCM10025865_33220 [Paraoerskovia sediminicola]BDZ44066.1 hypothetical protein GCM10025865_33650 [Paraoerskovia sediminicola]